MVTLIADSGSTKTDWALLSPAMYGRPASVTRIASQGISPIHQSDNEIQRILSSELLPHLSVENVSCVYFYGSGVRPEKEAPMVQVLREALACAEVVEAHSDLLGSARAVCDHNCGIASILGTGANACLYDGERIAKKTTALGYIIGDEGSGAVLGKRFLHDLYSGLLSKEIKEAFEAEMRLSLPEIINRVYRQPLANRFLASLAKFVRAHLDDPGVEALVRQNFADFLRLHITPFGRRDLPLSFVGSIAHHFAAQLTEVAEADGYAVGTILQSPIEGLIRYHKAV